MSVKAGVCLLRKMFFDMNKKKLKEMQDTINLHHTLTQYIVALKNMLCKNYFTIKAGFDDESVGVITDEHKKIIKEVISKMKEDAEEKLKKLEDALT